MLCHEFRCLFVHIPKTAGQSIETVFLAAVGLTWETRAPLLLRPNEQPELGPPRLAHLKALDYVRHGYMTPEQFRDYFKFCFVRDPWDRTLSLYRHLGFEQRCTFRDFVVDALPNRLWHEKPWFVCPQSDFVTDASSRCVVDFVGRYESLQLDFDQVGARVGLPTTTLPQVNVSRRQRDRPKPPGGPAPGSPSREDRSPQDVYDLEMQRVVTRLYARDFDTFGYPTNWDRA